MGQRVITSISPFRLLNSACETALPYGTASPCFTVLVKQHCQMALPYGTASPCFTVLAKQHCFTVLAKQHCFTVLAKQHCFTVFHRVAKERLLVFSSLAVKPGNDLVIIIIGDAGNFLHGGFQFGTVERFSHQCMMQQNTIFII
jgi:hypothetical protein